MDGEIIEQGVELMVYGMGTVVVFLTLLIAVTTMMSRVLARFFAEEAIEPIIVTSPASKNPHSDIPTVAIITSAIHQHRAKNK